MSELKGASVVVTGAAGFIGFHTARALLGRGARVIGVDDLNAYYPPALKRARLAQLAAQKGFAFHEADIADHERLKALSGVQDADAVVHLAAQAGVRYSLENPFAYARSNLVGHLSILELVRAMPKRPRLVYASSSSVYGANTKVPFAESDRVEAPASLYAATKRADELMSETYARLYGVEQIGLRFFTVYGPWGRPDMAYWSFAENILSGRPVRVFNNGDLKRDFTYIDDIIAGVAAAVEKPLKKAGDAPHRLYNLGNNRPVNLMRFIEILEDACGARAITEMAPMQPGDVYETYADIDAAAADLGYAPTTPLEKGIPVFVEWFRRYREGAA